jgi:hypothetical protein
MVNSMKSSSFVDRRRATAASAVAPLSSTATPLNYADVTKLRARLTAINAGRYTSAYLDTLTLNDMIYALRTLDDPTGI